MQHVSVIIPTFNRKHLIARSIDSVLAQSYTGFELIIIDDGSEDGTGDLIANYTDPRIRYYNTAVNRGVSAARNYGAKLATGEWLAFLDSDDQWHKSKLNRQIQWIRQNPTYAINQTREIWIRNGQRINPPLTHEKIGGSIFFESLERCMITPSSVIIRSTLFNDIGGFDESFIACEDYDLWLRITCNQQVGLIDEHLLTRYGGHPDQLSSSIPALDQFRVRSILKIMKSKVLNNDQYKAARELLLKKSSILLKGCIKRNRTEEIQFYESILRDFNEQVQTADFYICTPGRTETTRYGDRSPFCREWRKPFSHFGTSYYGYS